ncbi:MAG TPA: AraC family transcriptional regulator [Puia sp.]
MDKIIRIPKEFTTAPYGQGILKMNGLSVIESCSFTEETTGSMFLEDHLLIFVLEGVYRVRYGQEEYTVRKNQMVLLKKSILVEYRKYGEPGNNNLLDYMLFFLKDDLLKEFLKMANVQMDRAPELVPVSVNNVTERLLKYVESLKPYFNEPDSIDAGLIRIKLLELLFDLASADKNVMRQLLQMKQPARSNISVTVEENLLNPVSLTDLAYLSGRSLSSFKRDFQAIYNMPPSQWIREKRLDKAKELLSSTTMSVTDVCYTTGFENAAHFSRLFKDHFGYSPSSGKRVLQS